MGINVKHNFSKLGIDQKIWVVDHGIEINSRKIKSTPRIGVGYAEDHAFLPYRFVYEQKLIVETRGNI